MLMMGGIIVLLCGYIENNGGKVMVVFVMIVYEGVFDLVVKLKMFVGINEKYGLVMDVFWKEIFGYGID